MNFSLFNIFVISNLKTFPNKDVNLIKQINEYTFFEGRI